MITTPFIAMEPGADLVGPLPDELQQLIVYTAAIGSAAKEPDAAKALIKHLTTPEAAKLLRSNGLHCRHRLERAHSGYFDWLFRSVVAFSPTVTLSNLTPANDDCGEF